MILHHVLLNNVKKAFFLFFFFFWLFQSFRCFRCFEETWFCPSWIGCKIWSVSSPILLVIRTRSFSYEGKRLSTRPVFSQHSLSQNELNETWFEWWLIKRSLNVGEFIGIIINYLYSPFPLLILLIIGVMLVALIWNGVHPLGLNSVLKSITFFSFHQRVIWNEQDVRWNFQLQLLVNRCIVQLEEF